MSGQMSSDYKRAWAHAKRRRSGLYVREMATRGWSVSARIGYYTGPRSPSGCREWLGGFTKARPGFEYACLRVGGRAGRVEQVSRLILGLKPGDGLVARHKCDNPRCVEPSHLEPGTQADNTNDAIRRGRAHYPRRKRMVTS